ncbi:indolepyruvate oxidoreductase subunit beta [Candidatus Contubernalis alkaliaceticus]|uniref:indolepyruvate oxidoreductase subunit beta n=1 Tax=Candidatus Contubernalis alkaliaceticus TaxID=338645 RepID=UPI001F4BCF27|nr:indolepyruvate oxidoreductase subunit beta [Candidatus Contubernalis alkalaceticus]UNC93417.1 indolepyruvate oxidoreductase subunit beta [Candidatus Contubernalis alkalaceticus]
MNNTINLLLAGVGGQGTILASRIIAYAAQCSGLTVKLSEIHGMAQRGGSVVTHLRMGDTIHSPLIEVGSADIILATEQLEAWRWLPYLRQGGKVIVNSQKISPVPVILGLKSYPLGILERLKENVPETFSLNALQLARESGNEKAANVVLLGLLASHMNFDRGCWQEALKAVLPAKILEANEKAFQRGYDFK